MKTLIKAGLRAFGVDVVPYHHTCHEVARRRKLLQLLGTDLVVDVGANTGQYASRMRRVYNYAGRIISFEPLSTAFKELQKNLGNDKGWTGYNLALGPSPTIASINVAANSASSSLLPMLDRHNKAAPEAMIISTEQVKVERLDGIINENLSNAGRIYLKIDAQGYEKQVLDGCDGLTTKVDSIQLEMSLTQLYENAPSLTEMIGYMDEKNYQLCAIEPGFSLRGSGTMMQVDGIFIRRDRLAEIEETFR